MRPIRGGRPFHDCASVPAPRAWLENLRGLFRPRLLPVLGLAGASAALAAILLIPRHVPEPVVLGVVRKGDSIVTVAGRASHQNVAISASDPFADLGTVNLAAHVSSESMVDSEAAL